MTSIASCVTSIVSRPTSIVSRPTAIPADVVNHIAAYATSAEFISRKYVIAAITEEDDAQRWVVNVEFEHDNHTQTYTLGSFHHIGEQFSIFYPRAQDAIHRHYYHGCGNSISEFFVSVRNVLPMLLEHTIEDISLEWKTQTIVAALKEIVVKVTTGNPREITHIVQIPSTGMYVPAFSAENNIRCGKDCYSNSNMIISMDVFGFVRFCDVWPLSSTNKDIHPNVIGDCETDLSVEIMGVWVCDPTCVCTVRSVQHDDKPYEIVDQFGGYTSHQEAFRDIIGVAVRDMIFDIAAHPRTHTDEKIEHPYSFLGDRYLGFID